MLVIKAEIWPGGDADNKFEIARIGIINRGSNPATIADYNVISILGRDREEHVVEGCVLAHIRAHGWHALASRALLEHGPEIFHPDYTQAVVEMLKKG